MNAHSKLSPDDGDIRATLIEIGSRLITAMTSPEILPIYRAAVADPNVSPGWVKQFYQDGPGAVTTGLSDILRNAVERGEIRVENCTIAAEQFMGIVRGNLHLEVALGLRPAPAPAEIRRIARLAVEVFLDGVARHEILNL